MSRTKHHHHRQMHWAGPGWWHHLYSEKPRRAHERALERKAAKCAELDEVDGVQWPLAKKPHHYYY